MVAVPLFAHDGFASTRSGPAWSETKDEKGKLKFLLKNGLPKASIGKQRFSEKFAMAGVLLACIHYYQYAFQTISQANEMNTNNDTVAVACTEPCATEDDNDEPYSLHLSDEEILLSFLREGCDLDGTPLLMATEREMTPAGTYASRTLH